MNTEPDDEVEASGSFSTTSDNNEDVELVEVESDMNEDDDDDDDVNDSIDRRSSDNNVFECTVAQTNNRVDEEEETDSSDDDNYSNKESINVTQSNTRNVKLVLSKSRTSLTKTTTTDKSKSADDGFAATPQSNRTSASPIRIRLSLKKLPIVNKTSGGYETTYSNIVSNNVPEHKNAILPATTQNCNHNQSSDSLEADIDQKTVTSPNTTPLQSTSNSNGPDKDKTLNNTKLYQKPLPVISKAATGTASKRRSLLPSKQVRIPPINSPGLCMLRSPIPLPITSSDQSTLNGTRSTKYYTPQQIFHEVMSGAGYTYEQRSEHPHRGSSVQRTIDDMFDTNVKLALHPIELAPSDLWNCKASTNSSAVSHCTNQRGDNTLPHFLIRGLEDSRKTELQKRPRRLEVERYDIETGVRKRSRYLEKPLQFCDMVPVSLTIPYPEWYIQKRLEYVAQVKQRETSIVQWQDAQEELEIAQEDYDGHDLSDTETGVMIPRPTFINPITIPTIPNLPDPPKLHELCTSKLIFGGVNVDPSVKRELCISPYLGIELEVNKETIDESTHPIYIPKDKEVLVAHLDPNCFHITEGRYFALQTNFIADPNFVGSSAPGLTGISNTGALATATTSTTTSTSGLTGGGMTMILSASYHSAAAVAPTNLKDEATWSNKVQTSHAEEIVENTKTTDDKSLALCGTPTSVLSATSPMDKRHDINTEKASIKLSTTTTTTQTLSDLRKIMEGNDMALIETFRERIIRAIVHTFRSRRSCNIPFRGPNNETYPDIGKAFAWFGGVKPCDRCKSNKQGVCIVE
jgi:hypothetical protein